MNKRKIVSIIGLLSLVASIMVLPVLGESHESQSLDIEALEVNILRDNVELERYDERVMIAKYKLKKAEEEKDEGGANTIDFLKKRDYYPVEAQMDYDYAIWERAEKEQELTLKGKEYYYTYLLLDEEIALQNQKINRTRDVLQDAAKRVEVGLDKESAITDVEYMIENETYILRSLSNEKDRTKLEINVLMNKDMNAELDLKVVEIPFELYQINDLEEQIINVIEKNGDIIKLNKEESLAYIESNVYRNASIGEEYDREIIDLNEKGVEKGRDEEDKKVSIEYDIRSSYNKLLNAYDDISIKEFKINNLELDIDTAKKRFDLGLITKADVVELEEQLSFELLAIKKAKLDYYLAVETFKNFLEE